MRGLFVFFFFCFFSTGCGPHEQPRAVRAEAPKRGPADSGAPVTEPASTSSLPPTRIAHALVPYEAARGRGSLHRFRVPLEDVEVAFVDLGYERTLVEALGGNDLVINGGYWAYYGADRRIQGLLIVNGQPLAPLANTLSGGVLEVAAGRARLLPVRRSAISPSATLAIQCSPRLVDRGHVIPKLDSKRMAARTALCIRDQGRVLDAYLTADMALSLAELGEFLVAEGCEAALNLDGGPSTAAVYRGEQSVERVGFGSALPYALGFVLR